MNEQAQAQPFSSARVCKAKVGTQVSQGNPRMGWKRSTLCLRFQPSRYSYCTTGMGIHQLRLIRISVQQRFNARRSRAHGGSKVTSPGCVDSIVQNASRRWINLVLGRDSLDCFRFFRFFRIDPKKKIELLFKVNNSHPRQ